MVTNDEVLARSRQLTKDLLEVSRIFGESTEGKISDNPEIVLRLHDLPHVFEHDTVHMGR